MKLVSFDQKEMKLGLYIEDAVYSVYDCGLQVNMKLPKTMREFLAEAETLGPLLDKLQVQIKQNTDKFQKIPSPEILAPVPHPPSLRDGYAFRQHVETMRKNRGTEMVAEFDQFPIFYFSNHNAIFGPGRIYAEKDHFHQLDFELEVAIVVGKKGKNIAAKEADGYILGYMIWNDWSARYLQTQEMKLSLGPAKGKDFANSFGPYLVTKDELERYKIPTPDGNQYDLTMKAYYNGKQISQGNAKEMSWTFAQILERVSYGTYVYPGDIIGSGTVGSGCFGELNSTCQKVAQEKGHDFTPTWLKPADQIELEVTGLGTLKNTICLREPSYSILKEDV